MKIVTTEHFEIRIEDDRGDVFSVGIDPERGPRSSSGRLLAERGDGQLVEIGDPLRFFMQIYDIGFRMGRRFQRQRGGTDE